MMTLGVSSPPPPPRPRPMSPPSPIGRAARRNGDNSSTARPRSPPGGPHGNEGNGKDGLPSENPRKIIIRSWRFQGEAGFSPSSLILQQQLIGDGGVTS